MLARVGAFFLRLVVMLAGYVAASLAASAVLHVGLLAAAGSQAAEVAPLMIGSIFSVPFVALFVGYIALLPGSIAILAAELLGFRQAWTYGLLGAAAGLGVFGMFWMAGLNRGPGEGEAPGVALSDSGFALILLLGGAVAGLVYWLIAGRFTRPRTFPRALARS